jgi:hypothetical protein
MLWPNETRKKLLWTVERGLMNEPTKREMRHEQSAALSTMIVLAFAKKHHVFFFLDGMPPHRALIVVLDCWHVLRKNTDTVIACESENWAVCVSSAVPSVKRSGLL